MSNTIGNQIKLTLFGESHGPQIGAVLDGLTPGIYIDEEKIKRNLSLRRPDHKQETSRVETDEFEIISGVFQHYTTGAPLCILIKNNNIRSQDYEENAFLARPSHADYVAYEKYHGYADYRGGGHFSGRISAAIVAAGSILLSALEKFQIHLATHILRLGTIQDRSFQDVNKDVLFLKESSFPVLNDLQSACEEAMMKAKKEKDSIGGLTQTGVINLPVGLGEPWFCSLEGVLAQALFGIGGIKGIEFGAGFHFCDLKGSEANDPFFMSEQKVMTISNHSGGINGGISNGMPVIFSCAVRPTPSIAQVQKTIQLQKKENADLLICGRHDPAIVRRICIVITCLSAIVISDQLAVRYGKDVFLKDHLD